MTHPFKEKKNKDGTVTRYFSSEADQDELCWHRDPEDRQAVIVSCGDGWKFQFDNELPISLKKGSVLNIPERTWHRLYKGDGDLITIIQKGKKSKK